MADPNVYSVKDKKIIEHSNGTVTAKSGTTKMDEKPYLLSRDSESVGESDKYHNY